MNPSIPFSQGALGAAVLLCALNATAQQTGAPLGETPTLGEVTVTGNPLGSEQTVAPASSLAGDDLLLKQSATLGDTLQNLPGVSSTYFGPNAGRPVIRGLDGDRIRVLQNSGATVDASALSYDHNTPIDSLAVERVEVLRGPAALLYGGSAVGGVVNVLDNRIPKAPIAGPEGGYTGRADLGYASGNKEKSGAVLLEGGTDRYALHVDAFARDSGDVAAPIELPCTRSGEPSLARRICNSANRAEGGAVGGTLFFDRGYLGASVAGYNSRYGTVAEDDVRIGMRSTRTALEGLYRLPGGWLESVKGQLSYADYRHTEYEGEEAGTVFTNRGTDLRLEARHRPFGALQGVWGLQWEDTHFEALGDEAFVPPSHTQSVALFAHEELGFGWGKLHFGARAESVRVNTPGAGDDRFAAGSRSFHPGSVAFGGLVNVAPQWQLTGNLAYTQRAPKDYELFANGAHVATGTWELGDPRLGLEKSTGIDVGAKWQDGPYRFAVTAFASRFSNYIGLMNTGRMAGEGDEALPEYAYTGVKARFVGIEASGTVRLMGPGAMAEAARGSGHVLDLDLRADMVRATNLTSGEPLPRIAPARVGATLRWAQGAWGARLGFDYAAAQNRVPEPDHTTGAYTLWNAALTYKQKLGRTQLQWYARVDNLTNRLAYSATSVLTTTAFPRAPLPGRSVRVGVQAMF
ncbi:MAG: TonB-dependent receptor [Ottowia sp.]|uniref:TonB-dependent receptor n=1 Tax=Ottowia sp. TaxID=1898956 RepID=UPI003C742E45